MTALKERRLALKLTQAELARRVGVTMMTIQLWERNLCGPNEENAEKLEQALKLRELELKEADKNGFTRTTPNPFGHD